MSGRKRAARRARPGGWRAPRRGPPTPVSLPSHTSSGRRPAPARPGRRLLRVPGPLRVARCPCCAALRALLLRAVRRALARRARHVPDVPVQICDRRHRGRQGTLKEGGGAVAAMLDATAGDVVAAAPADVDRSPPPRQRSLPSPTPILTDAPAADTGARPRCTTPPPLRAPRACTRPRPRRARVSFGPRPAQPRCKRNGRTPARERHGGSGGEREGGAPPPRRDKPLLPSLVLQVLAPHPPPRRRAPPKRGVSAPRDARVAGRGDWIHSIKFFRRPDVDRQGEDGRQAGDRGGRQDGDCGRRPVERGLRRERGRRDVGARSSSRRRARLYFSPLPTPMHLSLPFTSMRRVATTNAANMATLGWGARGKWVSGVGERAISQRARLCQPSRTLRPWRTRRAGRAVPTPTGPPRPCRAGAP